MGLIDRFFKREKVYEQPYPNDVHNVLLKINKNINKLVSKKEAIQLSPSLDEIKLMEAQLPTHWIYKHITDPHQYTFRNLALQSSMVGEYDKVVSICLEGLDKFPDDPYLLYMLGRTLYDIGRVTQDINKIGEAVRVLDHVITLYQDFPDVYTERGKCRLIFNRIDDAEIDFLHAIELESDKQALRELFDMLDRIRAQKTRKYIGRGIKVFYYISPHLKDDKVLKEIGTLDIVTNFFHLGYVKGHTKDERGMWIKLFCPDAKFTLSNQKDEIEAIYSNIYNHVIDDAKSIFNTHGYKMRGYSFEIVYQVWPQENPDIIPMFKLESLRDREVDKE